MGCAASVSLGVVKVLRSIFCPGVKRSSFSMRVCSMKRDISPLLPPSLLEL